MSNKKKNRQLTAGISVFIALLLAPIFVYSQTCSGNPIQVENCLPGTPVTEWQISLSLTKNAPTNPAYGHEVEGYANKVSVNAGDTIRFHLNTNVSQRINIDIYRLGYYQGLSAKWKYSIQTNIINPQAFPIPDTIYGLAECNWPSPTGGSWDVPSNAVSGIYLAKLTGSSNGYQSYISFAVRRDDLNSDLLFQQSVTTYQAYNNYPGRMSTDNDSSLNGNLYIRTR